MSISTGRSGDPICPLGITQRWAPWSERGSWSQLYSLGGLLILGLDLKNDAVQIPIVVHGQHHVGAID